MELIPDIQSDVKAEDYSSLNHLLREQFDNKRIANSKKPLGKNKPSLTLSLRALKKTKEINSKNNLALNLIKRD